MSLKTKYRHTHFEKDGREWIWWNNNNKDMLGRVFYYPPWRQYVSGNHKEPDIFNNSCHDDVSHFLTQLNKQKKATGGKDK